MATNRMAVKFPVALLVGLAAFSAHDALAEGDDDLAITTVSNRADLVSGGDVLVRLTLPDGLARTGKFAVALNGRALPVPLNPAPDGRGYLALVTGLTPMHNELTLTVPGRAVRLHVTNHPIGGPVFSGPQIQPWTCAPGALDAQCNRATTYQFFYRPAVGTGFLPYDPGSPPAAAAVKQVTTTKGVTVPYVVRVETGRMDRDGYAIAVLYDPALPWAPWAPQAGWNGSVYVLQGAGCGTGYTEQAAPSPLNDNALSKGFAVVQLSLVNNNHNCNQIVQSEAVMMAKEHLVETYGLVDFTFGQGSSGGSISQLEDSNAYPGLYDGLIISAVFPDSDASRFQSWDCKLMWDHFAKPGTIPFTVEQKEAVSGYIGNCNAHVSTTRYEVYNPSVGTSCDVPDSQKFDALNNPGGVRCTLQDYQVNQVGRRPDGYANGRLDNVGVQYGLKALLAGSITAAQFVELNADAGGHDINFKRLTTRSSADPAGLPLLYRTGIDNMATNLDRVAILETRNPATDFHQPYHTNVLRARMDQAYGHHENHVLWRTMKTGGDPDFAAKAFDTMVAWLTAIKADPRDVPLQQKILEDKPALAHDRCTLGDGIDQDPSACPTPPAMPRILAGQDDSMHAGKCQLKPLARSDYGSVTFADAEWATLEATFPTGVCDNSKPLVGLQPTVPWLTYERVDGGEPLGAPPRSFRVRRDGREGEAD